MKMLIKATVIVFIAINVVIGGALQAKTDILEDEVVAETETREDLEVMGPVPIIWKETDIFESTELATLPPDAMRTADETDNSEKTEETEQSVQGEEGIISETENSETDDLNENVKEEEVKKPEVTPEPKKIQLGDITKNSSTTDRIRAILNYLLDEGFTPESAAGIIGNIAVESCFDPAMISDADYYGLFQWNTHSAGDYWWYDIENWLSKNGFEWNSFEGQVRAFVHCPSRGLMSESRFKELKRLKNVEQATELMAVFYEGCSGGEGKTQYYYVGSSYQALDTRKSEAWIVYSMYKDSSMKYNGEKAYCN